MNPKSKESACDVRKVRNFVFYAIFLPYGCDGFLCVTRRALFTIIAPEYLAVHTYGVR